MSYVYDEVGNRTQRTDYNGVVTGYTYDNLNRLTTITTRADRHLFLRSFEQSDAGDERKWLRFTSAIIIAIASSSFSDPFHYGISYNYDAVGQSHQAEGQWRKLCDLHLRFNEPFD